MLGSASCASNFCWIWLILKHSHSRLLFTFGLILVNPRFITCHDIIDVFRSTAIVFLEHFFQPIDTSLFFWAIFKLCGIQREQIFLTVKCSCNIECMLVSLMPIYMRLSQSHGRSYDDILQYQLAHSINGLRNNNWFWTTFTKFVYDHGWNHHTIDKWASLPKIELSSSMHCCRVNPRRKL